MEITAPTTQSAQSNSTSSLAGLSNNLDNFLKILTTQLQYQDPLSPLDTHEFTNQLVLFAGVEQQIQENKNLEQLITMQQNNLAVGAVSYIGRNIEASGQTNMLQNGEARFGYILPENAQAATLQISDASGTPILVSSAQTAAGRHEFVWDGKNILGQQVPDGAYTLTVSAANSDSQPISVEYRVSGRVTGVELVNGDATLALGDVAVPLARVTQIREIQGADGTL